MEIFFGHSPRGRRSGFTLAEMLVSVFILMLVATATMVNLRGSRDRDELLAATRVVASDLRALQSRALTAQDVKTCSDDSGSTVTCEINMTCANPVMCLPHPPYGVGVLFVVGSSTSDFFVDVDQTKNDWKYTDATEYTGTRDFAQAGGSSVVISDVRVDGLPHAMAHIAFQRQNGNAVLTGCNPMCHPAANISVILRHTKSNATRTISINALSGRISID